MPRPGAVCFPGDDDHHWIERNDGAFECIQTPPLRTARVHAVVDPIEQPAEWRVLADHARAHGCPAVCDVLLAALAA